MPKKAPAPPPAPEEQPLNFYGLRELGYADAIPLTGSYLPDQLAIECVCYRIGHRLEEGGLDKFGHYKRIVDLLWNNPDLRSSKRHIWSSWGERMISTACDGWKELAIAGCASAGKCWSPETDIMRYDGSLVKAKDVRPGDLLRGDDDIPRTVQEVHRGRGPMYRVTPQQGDPWECTGNHILILRSDEGVEVEIEAGDFLCADREFRDTYKQFKHGTCGSSRIKVEPIGKGDWVGFSVDGNHRVLLGDSTVSHNSDPFALYAVANYIADPTHTMVLILSTTLAGAKKRIWKSLREYWSAIPDLPGKALWSTNEVRGLSYDGVGYGDSSGIFLLASEQSSEREATERLQGIKAPRTGEPNESFEALRNSPEFLDLARHLDEETLRDLLPRLLNLCNDRIGRLIMIVDEATGCAESILSVCRINLAPGNVGHFQVIMLGNPKSYYDTFGLFCHPKNGWNSVTKEDEEWETSGGGICLRFNAERNPRIVEGNDKYSWMPREEDIKRLRDTYGEGSLFYHQMVLGFWCPEGTDAGVYNQSEIEVSGATTDHVTWGFEPPVRLSSLDPSFSSGGDRASCTFGLLGRDISGKMVLLREEEIAIQIDLTDRKTPPSYQVARKWRDECLRRGVPPSRASFDSTGGGITFGDVVRMVWSPSVRGVTFAGKATRDPVGNEKNPDGSPVSGTQRYANRMTQIWCGAHPFLRSGQIRGLSPTLAREMCSRRYERGGTGESSVLKVEGKREYKAREGKSPDESDSFLIMVDDAKVRHNFRPDDFRDAGAAPADDTGGATSWQAFKERARRIVRGKPLIG